MGGTSHLNNLPLASRQDRSFLETCGLHPQQIVPWLSGKGGIRFYIVANGYVKEFRAPSIVALLDRYAVAKTRAECQRSITGR